VISVTKFYIHSEDTKGKKRTHAQTNRQSHGRMQRRTDTRRQQYYLMPLAPNRRRRHKISHNFLPTKIN